MDKEIRKVDDVRDDITKIDYEIAELFEKRMGFAMQRLLIRNISKLVSCDESDTVYENVDLYRYYKEPIQSICHKGIRGSFYSDDVHKPQISVSYGSPERPLY